MALARFARSDHNFDEFCRVFHCSFFCDDMYRLQKIPGLPDKCERNLWNLI